MTTFVSHTLREVLPGETLTALGKTAETLGALVVETLEAVGVQWAPLESAFTLVPPADMSRALVTPTESIGDFRDALGEAKKALDDAGVNVFPALAQTRTDLQGTIQNLNERHYSYAMILDQEVAEFQADPENDPIINARNHPETTVYTNAKANLGVLDQEAERLALDVEMFNRAVDQAEQDLADKIRGISGGDSVLQARGSAVTAAQTAWGLTPPGPPAGPGETPPAVSLGDYLDLAITRAAADRINWFTTAGEKDVSDWMAAHPEFFAAIGLIPPAQANAILDRLRNRSTADASGKWVTGPLATLWDRAPGSIGNLNGVKTADRVPWSTRALELLLDDPALTDDQRAKLTLLADQERLGLKVLSVFLDQNGAPRASLVLGDPDTAQQVITVTHGIQTDLATLEEWGKVAYDIYSGTNQQIDFRNIDSETAVVLQMEWDSGWVGSVWGEDLPSRGASRTVALVEGLRHINPDAWQEGWAHSLGTTSTAVASEQSAGVFDHLTLFGSAGLTPEANAALEDAIANDGVSVSVADADTDWIRGFGMVPGGSTHPIDPAGSVGVDIIGADGGAVPDYISPDGQPVIGLPVGGHNAGASTDILYRLPRSPGWNPVLFPMAGPLGALSLMPEDSVGYMDPRGQSYLQAVADHAERVEERR
ncbi:alpha/beta hydrolase [Microbacterium sp. NPDC090225]|uniref:alpha/beta hydrolase n=1 Tax=Microbacterium sp. NPDC090225 TaxID=3364207 RepID=UPI00382A2F2A